MISEVAIVGVESLVHWISHLTVALREKTNKKLILQPQPMMPSTQMQPNFFHEC
jgi:hypothetical protein